MFYIYAIYNSKCQRIYIGQTYDLEKRLKEHNDLNNLTHTYTRRFGSGWKLIYKEEVSTRIEALKREKQLKSYQGRLFIKNLTKVV